MDPQVKELQGVLLQMLKDIDAVCRENAISYQLFAGSALGAVRHHGFIPWDDDLDIAMPREDYERFLSIAGEQLDREKYYLQKEFSDHYGMFSSKLRLNGTTYMERYIPRDKQMHQGIFIDVFPLDNLSDKALTAKLQFYASKVVIAKSLRKRGYASDSLKKKAFMLFCAILPRTPFLRFAQRKRDVDSKNIHSFFGGSSKFSKSIYPRSVLLTERIPFEDGEFPVSLEYDTLLTIQYGDYMTLPDEKDRDVKRHFLKADIHNGYERYLEWQSRQVIKEYTRSIR